jgi:hypothetical protein
MQTRVGFRRSTCPCQRPTLDDLIIDLYAHIVPTTLHYEIPMAVPRLEINAGACNSTALRKAARRVTRFYDACMSESGLRATQYTILALLAD